MVRRPARSKPLILRVTSRMAVGGVQRGILATLARADRARFDFALLCTKKEGKWAEEVRALGVPLYCQKTLPPWDPYQIGRLSRVIRKIAPDLVHIHMAPLVIPVASSAMLAGAPYVIQWHSNYERFWNEQQNGLLRAWERRLTLRAKAIFAVSESAAAANAREMGLARERVRVVTNGIDLAQWRNRDRHDPRIEWNLPADTPLVVHVSRYLETKNIEDFIEAAGRISARWPPHRTAPAFVAIGGGPEHYRQQYERKLAQVLADFPRAKVWLEGERGDLPALLPSANVGVLATENEGCPNVILEYMGLGLPMVASEIAPIAELVRHEETALLVPPKNAEALAQAIERLLLDGALARRLRENCLKEAPKHDWAATAGGYEAIYDEVLQRIQAGR